MCNAHLWKVLCLFWPKSNPCTQTHTDTHKCNKHDCQMQLANEKLDSIWRWLLLMLSFVRSFVFGFFDSHSGATPQTKSNYVFPLRDNFHIIYLFFVFPFLSLCPVLPSGLSFGFVCDYFCFVKSSLVCLQFLFKFINHLHNFFSIFELIWVKTEKNVLRITKWA